MPAETPQLFDKNVSLNQTAILDILTFQKNAHLALAEGNLRDSIMWANLSWSRIPEDVRAGIVKPGKKLRELEALIPIRSEMKNSPYYPEAKESFDTSDAGYGNLDEDDAIYLKIKFLVQGEQWVEILEEYGELMVKKTTEAGLYISTSRRIIPTADRTPTEPLPIMVKLGASVPRK